ncbi:MAG: glycosyltransferase family 2 protein [Planctomycetaceae bacterium]
MSGVPARRPISGVVITRDAGPRLAATLVSLAGCAERLVLDSGSTDGTIELALALAARVEHQPFLGFGLQKRRAVELAAHDWILSLDADETLDEEARSAVAAVDLADPAACYAFRRRTFIGRREVRHGAWREERVLRLFNRTTAAFKPLPVHEQVVGSRPPLPLPGSIIHHSYADCADVVARTARYAPLKAAIIRDKGQSVATWTLPCRGLAAFVRSYLLRGGWRDGAAGFVIAVSRVLDSTLPRALLLEERRPADPEGPDDHPPRP